MQDEDRTPIPGLRAAHEGALGGCWASVCHAVWYAKQIGRPFPLATKIDWRGGRDYGSKMREIIPLIQDATELVPVVEGYGSRLKRQIWHTPRMPTIIQWDGGSSQTVTYQFDGQSRGHLKNFSADEEARILQAIRDLGLTPVRVGGHEIAPPLKDSLKDCVQAMARARFHLNVDSGFAHVGLSVRVPVVVCKNRNVRTPRFYSGTSAIFTENCDQTIAKMRELACARP
jgi:hypothetical protein